MDNLISSTIRETGYVPCDTYEITVTVSGSGNYITHISGNNSNPAVWVFT